MILSLLFSLVHKVELSPLHVVVLVKFLALPLDHSVFLLDLSIQLSLHLPLLFLFPDDLELLLLFIEFLVELDDCGPFVIFVSQLVETLLLTRRLVTTCVVTFEVRLLFPVHTHL